MWAIWSTISIDKIVFHKTLHINIIIERGGGREGDGEVRETGREGDNDLCALLESCKSEFGIHFKSREESWSRVRYPWRGWVNPGCAVLSKLIRIIMLTTTIGKKSIYNIS